MLASRSVINVSPTLFHHATNECFNNNIGGEREAEFLAIYIMDVVQNNNNMAYKIIEDDTFKGLQILFA
jgi:hypothetical protein